MKEGRKGEDDSFYEKRGEARQGDLYGKTALILDECVAPFKLILSFPFCSVPSRDAPTASHCSQPRPIPVISLFLRSIRYKAAIFPRRPRPRPPRPDAFERKRQFVYMLSAGGETINPISISSDSGGRHLQFVSVSSFKKRYPWRSRVLVVRIQRYAMLNELQHKS